MTGYVRHRSYRRHTRRPLRKRRYTRRRFPMRKRRTRRRFVKRGGRLAKLSRKVKKLAQTMSSTTGTLTYRSAAYDRVDCNENQQGIIAFEMNAKTSIELVLGQLRYYNPEIPGTLTVADFDTGTFQKSIRFVSTHMKATFRANYLVPVDLTIYVLRCTDDSGLAPLALWTAGMLDISNATVTNPLSFPSDSRPLMDSWSLKRVKHLVLQPGQQTTVSANGGSFLYDPSVQDEFTALFQRNFKSFAFMAVVKGVIAHDDSFPLEQGIGRTLCDLEVFRTFNVKYDAGADIHFVYTQGGGGDIFTGFPNISNKPAAAQQVPTL